MAIAKSKIAVVGSVNKKSKSEVKVRYYLGKG